MPRAPLVERRRPGRRGAGGGEQPVLRLVPALRGGVDPVPGELVDEQQRRDLGEPVEPRRRAVARGGARVLRPPRRTRRARRPGSAPGRTARPRARVGRRRPRRSPPRRAPGRGRPRRRSRPRAHDAGRREMVQYELGEAGRVVSLAEIRRRVTGAQAYAVRRPAPAAAAEVVAAIRRAACVQLDSISTVERAHRIALGRGSARTREAAVSAVAPHAAASSSTGPTRPASLPVEDYPVHRWRMARYAVEHPWHGNVLEPRAGADRARARGDPRPRSARLA